WCAVVLPGDHRSYSNGHLSGAVAESATRFFEWGSSPSTITAGAPILGMVQHCCFGNVDIVGHSYWDVTAGGHHQNNPPWFRAIEFHCRTFCRSVWCRVTYA